MYRKSYIYACEIYCFNNNDNNKDRRDVDGTENS